MFNPPRAPLPPVPGLPQPEAVPADKFARRVKEIAPRQLSDTEVEDLSQQSACTYCRGYHVRACPKLKRISFHSNGNTAEVEFWPPAEVDWTGVVFLDQGGIDDDIEGTTYHALHLLLETLNRPAVLAQVRRRADRGDVESAVYRLRHLLDTRAASVVDSGAE